ncbi:MAG: YfhO family protein [bacterium]|nr:YfhO family protein [bacterium]
MPTLVCFNAAFLSVWLCYSVMLGLLLQKRLSQLLLLDGFTFLPFLFPAVGIAELSDAVIYCLAAKAVVLCGLIILNCKSTFNKLIFRRKDICALLIISVSLIAFYLTSFIKRYSSYYSETTDFCLSVHLMNIIKHMDIPIWAAEKFSGMPAFTNITCNPFEFLNYAILFFPGSFVDMMDIFYWTNITPRLISLFIITVGMYFLVKDLGLGRLSATVCALLSSLSYLILVNMFYEVGAFYPIVFFPFLICYTRRLALQLNVSNLLIFIIVTILSYNLFLVNVLEYNKSITLIQMLYVLIICITLRRISPFANIALGFILSVLAMGFRWLSFFLYAAQNPALLQDNAPDSFMKYNSDWFLPPWFNIFHAPEMFFQGTPYYYGITLLLLMIFGFAYGLKLLSKTPCPKSTSDSIRQADFCFWCSCLILLVIFYLGHNTILPRFMNEHLSFAVVHNHTRLQWLTGFTFVVLAGYGLQACTIKTGTVEKSFRLPILIFFLIFIVSFAYCCLSGNYMSEELVRGALPPLIISTAALFILYAIQKTNSPVWKTLLVILIFWDASTCISNRYLPQNANPLNQDTCRMDNTDNWVALGKAQMGFENDHYTFTSAGTGYDAIRLLDYINLTEGQKYRARVKVKNGTATNVPVQLSTFTSQFTTASKPLITTGQWREVVLEFTAKGNETAICIYSSQNMQGKAIHIMDYILTQAHGTTSLRGVESDLRAQLNYVRHNPTDQKASHDFKNKITALIHNNHNQLPKEFDRVADASFWNFDNLDEASRHLRYNYLEDRILPQLNSFIRKPPFFLFPQSPFTYNEYVKPLYQESGYYRFISSLGNGDWISNISANARFHMYNAGGVCPNAYPNYRFKQYPKSYDYYFPPTDEIQGGGGNVTFFAQNRWMLDLLNIKYIAGPHRIPGLQKLSNNLSVNPTVMPRALMLYDYRVDPEAKSMDGIDHRKTLLLESLSDNDAALLKSGAGVKNAASEVKIEKIFGNYALFRVSTPKPGLLFYSDNYDSGWTARVDGEKVKVYKADLSFKAAVVPTGEHLVWFEYKPLSVYIGWLVTCFIISILFLLCYLEQSRKWAQ